jgi:hypothetical protein
LSTDDDPGRANRRATGLRPFQFSLRSILFVTTVFAVLFAVCRLANLSVWASLLVTLLFVVSLAGGFALIVALAHSLGDGENE